jgi:hypothetical protein
MHLGFSTGNDHKGMSDGEGIVLQQQHRQIFLKSPFEYFDTSIEFLKMFNFYFVIIYMYNII